MKKIHFGSIVVALGASLALGACSVVSTPPDMVALQYSGGLSSQTFEKCIPASTRDQNGPSQNYFLYPSPSNRRTYEASDAKNAESPPITVVSKDNAEMKVPVSVTLTLKSGDCATLRKFHESIGNTRKAFWGGSDFEDQNKDGVPDGWVTVLNFYIGKSLDAMLDRQAQEYNWRDLWNDPAAKAKIEGEISKTLAATVDDRMGGSFFTIDSILLAKPDPVNVALKEAVSAEQTAVAKAKSAEMEAKAQETSAVAQAKAQQASAEAQVAVAKAQAAQMEEQIRVLGVDGYLKKLGIEKGVTPWPNPVVPGSGTTPATK